MFSTTFLLAVPTASPGTLAAAARSAICRGVCLLLEVRAKFRSSASHRSQPGVSLSAAAQGGTTLSDSCSAAHNVTAATQPHADTARQAEETFSHRLTVPTANRESQDALQQRPLEVTMPGDIRQQSKGSTAMWALPQ